MIITGPQPEESKSEAPQPQKRIVGPGVIAFGIIVLVLGGIGTYLLRQEMRETERQIEQTRQEDEARRSRFREATLAMSIQIANDLYSQLTELDKIGYDSALKTAATRSDRRQAEMLFELQGLKRQYDRDQAIREAREKYQRR